MDKRDGKDTNKQPVTEEMHLEKAWYDEARKMTEEDLPDFFERIMHGYDHDYGTVCHAVAACAVAAAWAACKEGGLTGFQAGIVMWGFIKNWTKQSNECGLKLIDYDDMLYPQYEERFEKTINKQTWRKIREKAVELLATSSHAHPDVVEHWRKIANWEVPFGYWVRED